MNKGKIPSSWRAQTIIISSKNWHPIHTGRCNPLNKWSQKEDYIATKISRNKIEISIKWTGCQEHIKSKSHRKTTIRGESACRIKKLGHRCTLRGQSISQWSHLLTKIMAKIPVLSNHTKGRVLEKLRKITNMKIKPIWEVLLISVRPWIS